MEYHLFDFADKLLGSSFSVLISSILNILYFEDVLRPFWLWKQVMDKLVDIALFLNREIDNIFGNPGMYWLILDSCYIWNFFPIFFFWYRKLHKWKIIALVHVSLVAFLFPSTLLSFQCSKKRLG